MRSGTAANAHAQGLNVHSPAAGDQDLAVGREGHVEDHGRVWLPHDRQLLGVVRIPKRERIGRHREDQEFSVGTERHGRLVQSDSFQLALSLEMTGGRVVEVDRVERAAHRRGGNRQQRTIGRKTDHMAVVAAEKIEIGRRLRLPPEQFSLGDIPDRDGAQAAAGRLGCGRRESIAGRHGDGDMMRRQVAAIGRELHEGRGLQPFCLQDARRGLGRRGNAGSRQHGRHRNQPQQSDEKRSSHRRLLSVPAVNKDRRRCPARHIQDTRAAN